MPAPATPLILASRSPRRQRLLTEAGYQFEVRPPHEEAECGVCSQETPPQLVARLAWQKAADVARNVTAGVVLGCDTVVECCGQILGKPRDREDARRMLRLLAGRQHRVFSGLCLWPQPQGHPRVEVATTLLCMDRWDDACLEAYLASEAWEGKAGAFGYQDQHPWIHILQGSVSNVIGLPLELLETMLQQLP